MAAVLSIERLDLEQRGHDAASSGTPRYARSPRGSSGSRRPCRRDRDAVIEHRDVLADSITRTISCSIRRSPRRTARRSSWISFASLRFFSTAFIPATASSEEQQTFGSVASAARSLRRRCRHNGSLFALSLPRGARWADHVESSSERSVMAWVFSATYQRLCASGLRTSRSAAEASGGARCRATVELGRTAVFLELPQARFCDRRLLFPAILAPRARSSPASASYTPSRD